MSTNEATVTKDKVAAGRRLFGIGWLGVGVGLLIVLAWPFLVGNNTFWLTLWAQLALLMLLTSALNLALGYTDLVSIAHTALYMSGAYACGLLVVKWKLDFWLALPVAMIVAGLLGAVMTLATLRVSHIYFAIVTLSFNLILVQLALAWDTLTGGQDGLTGLQRPKIGTERLDLTQYGYLVWGLTLISLWIILNLVRSKFGRAFVAIRGDEATAAALGIAPFKYKLISFVTSSALAGLAGALYAFLNGFVNPTLGDSGGTVALSVFIALFVGGVGTFVGPLVGAIFATGLDRLLTVGGDWLNNLTNNPSNSAYQTLAYGLLLLLTMALLPGGIVGSWNKSRSGTPLEQPTGSGLPAATHRLGAGRSVGVAGQPTARRGGGSTALSGTGYEQELWRLAGSARGGYGDRGRRDTRPDRAERQRQINFCKRD